MGEDFLTILGMLIVFAVVLFLAYVTTKLLGKKMAGGMKNKTMKIVETLPIGLDRCLHLIRVGKRYFLFNSSKKNLELVSEIELDEEAIEAQESVSEASKIFDFKRIFESYSGLGKAKPSKEEKTDTSSVEDQTKSGGILENIRKLQKITQGKESYKG